MYSMDLGLAHFEHVHGTCSSYFFGGGQPSLWLLLSLTAPPLCSSGHLHCWGVSSSSFNWEASTCIKYRGRCSDNNFPAGIFHIRVSGWGTDDGPGGIGATWHPYICLPKHVFWFFKYVWLHWGGWWGTSYEGRELWWWTRSDIG